MGMRLHTKKTKPHVYNIETENQSNHIKVRWTDIEIRHMAETEVSYGESSVGLLDHLVIICGRTRESIKG